MPHTAKGERRQTTRTRVPVPNLTTQYRAEGTPEPVTLEQAKKAAKKHFRQTRGSKGAYRVWVRITTRKGGVLRARQTQVVCYQLHRNGDVELYGTTTAA